jgi:hypothetical protein
MAPATDAEVSAVCPSGQGGLAKLPPQKAAQHHAVCGGTPEPELRPGEGLETTI